MKKTNAVAGDDNNNNNNLRKFLSKFFKSLNYDTKQKIYILHLRRKLWNLLKINISELIF